MLKKLESYFEFERLGTNWRTEILAGLTTFVTMAYIVIVNPSILKLTGMPLGAVTAATCLSAAFASILMGAFAKYPLALAPGMGLNAYFAYVVCLKMHVPWQVALGAVFCSGVIFLIITVAGIRQMILEAIPHELYAAVAGGIGLFIAFIGFRGAGFVTSDPATVLTMGNMRTPTVGLAVFGLLLIILLEVFHVRGSILIGVVATTILAAFCGQIPKAPDLGGVSALSQTAFHLNIGGALAQGALEIIFVFFFVDLFDNLGTLVGVTKRAGLIDDAHHIPRLNRILFSDAIATIFGSFTGTSTVTSYVESTAGVAAGGRSGVTAIVTGVLFLFALLAAPLVGYVPAAATAPALIYVGALMTATVAEIDWKNPKICVPAFLTFVMIPFTYSIANGLGCGVISWAVIKILTGEIRKKDWLLCILAILFLARFIYLGAS